MPCAGSGRRSVAPPSRRRGDRSRPCLTLPPARARGPRLASRHCGPRHRNVLLHVVNITGAAILDVAGARTQSSATGLSSVLTQLIALPSPVLAGGFFSTSDAPRRSTWRPASWWWERWSCCRSGSTAERTARPLADSRGRLSRDRTRDFHDAPGLRRGGGDRLRRLTRSRDGNELLLRGKGEGTGFWSRPRRAGVPVIFPPAKLVELVGAFLLTDRT